jgi:formylglycine-generating enzyme required for sulfatase activity
MKPKAIEWRKQHPVCKLKLRPRPVTTYALEFLILTAVRKSQILNMRWQDVDWENKVWVCTEHKTKKKVKQNYLVPLSDQALAILEEMRRQQIEDGVKSEFVFTAEGRVKRMSSSSLNVLMERGVSSASAPPRIRSRTSAPCPSLSYTLDDMWTHMLRRGDGTLRLPAQSFELGGVLVDRANKFLETHPGAEDALRRVFTLRLATVRGDGEPTRRRAARSEFSEYEWRLVSELADYPNRLLVTATAEGGETYAEVAHEAIFRRWYKLRDWIAEEREFLKWRSGLEHVRREWQAAPLQSKNDAVLMGFALDQAMSWLVNRADDIPAPDHNFIFESRKAALRRRLRRTQWVVAEAGVILLATLWISQQQYFWQTSYSLINIWPYVLNTAAEQRLKAGDSFQECAKGCPEMIVVPPGEFWMGSPDGQGESEEHPHHKVKIDRPFAVGKFAVTWDEWDACVWTTACVQNFYSDFGKGRQPVINVGWGEAKQYVAWLSRATGKHYRLLSEAEWEYAARGITSADAHHPTYPWGDTASHEYANYGEDQCCKGKIEGRDQWLNTAPVGQFPPNDFGLYDMVGNVWQWVEDRWHDDYSGAPSDGRVWAEGGEESLRVVRGGSWIASPQYIHSASRDKDSILIRSGGLGFRVARSLAP